MAEPDVTEASMSEDDLVNLVRDRYKVMYDADHENRLAAMDDLKFINVPGYQWEDNMKQERGKRPCYEFNKLRTTIKRIINDIRANRPAGKVRAVEGGDKPAADINEGLIRNIWNVSDADTVVDYAAESQVGAGMGAWRVNTEYVDDATFNQDIKIEQVPNPFCLYCDPSALDPMKRDAADWLYTEKIPYKAYEKRFPGEEKVDFEDMNEFDDNEDWQDEESVRIAEYWYKEPHEKEIWLLDSGQTVDSESDEAGGIDEERIVKRRMVMTEKIMYVTVNGKKVLEEPREWAGTMFPWIMVYGEFLVIDGTPYWWGLTRFAKDAQRSYNVSRTAIIETIAQAPKSQWWATEAQAKGMTNQWAEAHKKNLPFMLYNPDPKAPGPPTRMAGPEIPAALMQEAALATEDLKAITGIFDPSLGASSNETSGRAIYARQQQGEIATFNFQDNIAKGVQRTYELLIDLIPNIYDTARELRILGTDGAEDYVRVNEIVVDPETGEPVRVNDITSGKYDVTVTVGPNFATQRQEAAEIYTQLGQQTPDLMGVAGDLIFKSMDLPYAEEIAERMQTLLPPPVQDIINKEVDDPAVQQAMAAADAAMAQVQEMAQQVAATGQEVEQGKAENEKLLANIKTEIANVRAARAEFDAHIAEQNAALVDKAAGVTLKDASVTSQAADLKSQAADLAVNRVSEYVDSAQALDSVSRIDEVLAQFMAAVDVSVGRLAEREAELERGVSRRPVGGTVSRGDGRITADVEYDDGTTRSVSAVRENGQLRIVPDGQDNPATDGQE